MIRTHYYGYLRLKLKTKKSFRSFCFHESFIYLRLIVVICYFKFIVYEKNLFKPFLVTLLVIFCSVSVNAQRVENGKLLSWDGAAGSIVAIPQI